MANKTGYAAPPAPAQKEFARARVAIVVTRWNTGIVAALEAGARKALRDWGVAATRIDRYAVPGAYEIPLAAELIARRGKHDGVVTLGAVIRGDTPHFDFVAGECARGLQDVAMKHAFPLGFGVLTVNTAAQAASRSRPGRSNKGYEATAAMLEMLRLKRELK